MNIDKDKIQKKFHEVNTSQLRINIAMNALDEMLEAMPKVTAWRGWRYPGWTDEEIIFFRDLLYMHGGYRRYRKNKKPPTTLLPHDGSSHWRERTPIDRAYEK